MFTLKLDFISCAIRDGFANPVTYIHIAVLWHSYLLTILHNNLHASSFTHIEPIEALYAPIGVHHNYEKLIYYLSAVYYCIIIVIYSNLFF